MRVARFCYYHAMRTVSVKWKYAAIGLGAGLIVQFLVWNRLAPTVLNLPRIPLLSA